MPSRTKYTVDVFLDPASPPTSNKGVIWDADSGSFGLGDSGGSGLTTCSLNESHSTGTRYIYIDNIDLSAGGDHCIKGELHGTVKDNSRYQIARIVVGFFNNTNNTTKITVKEDVRYPDSKVIYNINSFTPAWQSATQLRIDFTQYTTGPTSDYTVDYCFNYILF